MGKQAAERERVLLVGMQKAVGEREERRLEEGLMKTNTLETRMEDASSIVKDANKNQGLQSKKSPNKLILAPNF